MHNHEFYMQLALQNTIAMKGQTETNPLVGSVIVNDNRIVGIGIHMKAGEPHAEIRHRTFSSVVISMSDKTTGFI